MASFIKGEASPDPSLQDRVRAIRNALDEVHRTERCYVAISDLLAPSKLAPDFEMLNRADLHCLLDVINAKLRDEIDQINDEFQSVWTEVQSC